MYALLAVALYGIATAYMLNESGLNITIVEKNEMGMGVTANTTAKLTSQHGLFYDYLVTNFSEDYARKYLEANEEAITLVKSIVEKEHIDCDMEEQDAYVYTNVESEIPKIKEEVDSLESIGFDAEFVTETPLPFNVLRCY